MRSHFRTSDISQISMFITFSSHITSPNFEFNVIIWHYGRLSDTFEIKTLCLAPSLELLDWPDNITFIILPKSYFTRYFVSSWITLHKSLTLQKKNKQWIKTAFLSEKSLLPASRSFSCKHFCSLVTNWANDFSSSRAPQKKHPFNILSDSKCSKLWAPHKRCYWIQQETLWP